MTRATAATRPAHLAPLQLGWPLGLRPDDGALAYPSLEDSIRDQIKIVLLTRPGELLLHPTFGAGLEDLLHQPNTLTTRRRIRDVIARALERWEPRIQVDAVEVTEADGRPDAVRVALRYRIRRTGVAETFPFDLVLGA